LPSVRARSFTLFAAGAFLISACGSSSTGSTIKEGGTLTWALDADAQGLNPFENAADVSSARAAAPLYAGLYMADPKLNIIPDLAAGMPTVSTDGKVWTVKLRPGLKWSDGSPLTADDVVFTVNTESNPDLDSQVGFDWSFLDKVEKVDDTTIKFTLKNAYAPFLSALAFSPAPKKIFGTVDIKKMSTDPTNLDPKVFSGPFMLDKRVPGQEIDYVPNPNYYGHKPHLAKIIAKIITDATAAVNALINGDVQWDPEITAGVAQAKAASGVTVYQYPDLGYYDVRMNTRAGHPFADENVRKAFSYALDKTSIVNTATDGLGHTLWGDIPPASWAFDESNVVKYTQDVAKANSLLDAAGWVKGADGIRVKNGKRFSYDFCVRSGKPQRKKANEIIADQVRAIGMELKVKEIDFKVYYKGLKNGGCGIQTGEYDIAFAGWGLALDPDDYTVLSPKEVAPEVNKGGQNWTGYGLNPADKATADQLASLIDQERTTVKATDADTKAARKAIFNQIQAILGGHVVTYFMWADGKGMGFSKKVGGVVSGPNGDMNYADQGRNPSVFADWYLQ
jgi:peptide/nickel transport system substrate-binding protein